MFFVETKRLYNYLISLNRDGHEIPDPKDYKQFKAIKYLDKDRNQIDYTLQYICSSVVSDTITLMHDSIKSIAALKRKGLPTGRLNFKSECNSIRLRQYGVTHSIRGSRIKIQGIKRPIRVRGLRQLEKYRDIDYTTAQLIWDGCDYYISLTCYVDKDEISALERKNNKNKIIGIDLGCRNTMNLSNGEKLDVKVEESERLKGLQARLARQQRCSNNWYKTRSQIRKECRKMKDKKNDLVNKAVHYITSNNEIVVFQDDPINQWHMNPGQSRTVQHSALGTIKSKLKRYEGTVVLDQWFPTTSYCFECGHKTPHDVSKTTYKCSVCGHSDDRDLHAANNMILFYKAIQSAGTVDLTPSKKILHYKDFENGKLTGPSVRE